ncbi:hypothetical protein DMJ13_09430 [halophilic archaeon]|nr:hypothetical protein DMJ13_09430 [halophilic archaeon]
MFGTNARRPRRATEPSNSSTTAATDALPLSNRFRAGRDAAFARAGTGRPGAFVGMPTRGGVR